MKYLHDYAVIGGDLRQVYLAEALAGPETSVIYYGLAKFPNNCQKAKSLKEALHSASCIICPIPFSKNGAQLNVNIMEATPSLSSLLTMLEPGQSFFAGCIPDAFMDEAKEKGVHVYDLMKNNSLAIYNTIATAEGAICEAIQKSPENLHHSKCAVLGYGRCGRTLTNYLKGMFCSVYVYSNAEDERALADTVADRAGCLEEFSECAGELDFIFNTIPAQVLTEEILVKMKPSVTIIDIASAPGGVDYAAASRHNISAFHCLGLPGKYSPASCAKTIKKFIRSELECLYGTKKSE